MRLATLALPDEDDELVCPVAAVSKSERHIGHVECSAVHVWMPGQPFAATKWHVCPHASVSVLLCPGETSSKQSGHFWSSSELPFSSSFPPFLLEPELEPEDSMPHSE